MTDRICYGPGCSRRAEKRGLCGGHYRQDWRGQPLSPLSPRFKKRPNRPQAIDPITWFRTGLDVSGGPEACHEWQHGFANKGYGKASTEMEAIYGTRRSHVLIWILENGPIPNGLHVLHTCDNPPCGNINHLFLGTNDDNIADKIAKGRQDRGERHHWAKLTDEQVAAIRIDTRVHSIIAAEYGVGRRAIDRIKTGERRRS